MKKTDASPSAVIASPVQYRAARSLTHNETPQDSIPRLTWQDLKNYKKNRSPGTVQTYHAHARPFIEHFLAEYFPSAPGCPPYPALQPQDWNKFPAWFAYSYRNAQWCRQTLKVVKIALCYVLGKVLDKDGLAHIRNFMPCSVKEKGSMGMALHEKNPDIRQIKDILTWLDAQRTFLSRLAAAWFRAEIVTGLRPKEWRHACYKDRETGGTISIINGKQNDMLCQGTGIDRHLVYRGPEHEASRSILRNFFLLKDEYFRQYAQEKGYTEEKCFARMHRNCQKMYRRANMFLRMGRPVSVQEKNITLYSLRDAFKADAFSLMQAGPERRRDIAALMGHSNLFSQDMYAPQHRTLGRKIMPAAPARDGQNTRQTLWLPDSRIQEENAYAWKNNRQAEDLSFPEHGPACRP